MAREARGPSAPPRQARGQKNVKFSFKQISPYFDHLGASRAPKIFLRAWVVGEGVPKGSPDFCQNFPELSHF